MKNMQIIPDEYVKVSERGQITVPKAVRSFLSLEAGDHIRIHISDKGIVMLRPVDDTSTRTKLRTFIEQSLKDPQSYWSNEDESDRSEQKNLSVYKISRIWYEDRA